MMSALSRSVDRADELCQNWQPVSWSLTLGREDLTETPATRDPECDEKHHPTIPGRVDIVCPELGPRNIEANLRSRYNNHMEEKATRQARSEAVERFELRVVIGTSTEDAVGDVVEFLNDNGARFVSSSRTGDASGAGAVSADVGLELLFSIAEIEGVLRIKRIRPRSRGSYGGQGVPLLAAQGWRLTSGAGWGDVVRRDWVPSSAMVLVLSMAPARRLLRVMQQAAWL